MLVKPRTDCDGCLKPTARRLGLFQAKDEYECYAESYVKCFWGLCDLHKSNENIIRTPLIEVVTEQPRPQELPYNDPRIVKNFTVKIK